MQVNVKEDLQPFQELGLMCLAAQCEGVTKPVSVATINPLITTTHCVAV